MTEELRRRREQLAQELNRIDAELAEAGGEKSGAQTPGSAEPAPGSIEERFRTLVEYAPDAMVILDADSGRFVDVNDHACRLFGLPRERLLEVGPADVSPATQPDGRSSTEAASGWIQETVAGRPVEFEWAHCDASGDVVPCEVRLVRLPHADRRWVRGSIVDISERKRAADERERLSKQLTQAQKMQAIGQLTGGVAHDFNNLLTVILGALSMIRDDSEDAGEVRAQADQAMAAADRAATLTQQLLAFARRQPLRRQTVNVNRLLADTESLLRRALGEAVEIETVLGGGLWRCETDPAQLENVILNLALNARDAMPDGGRLTIETANMRLDREYALEHDEVEPGQYVMLAVSDTGSGMAADVLEQAFEPFFTTKDVGYGTGLGLSMVYGFVKQCGGHIKLYTEPGDGTTVRIYLPRAHSGEPSAPGGETVHSSGDAASEGEGHLVLVVEDEELVRGLIVKGLTSLGYRTLSAGDVDEALETVRDTDGIALLLTDVILAGGAKGTELARAARETRPGLPVLFMSGYALSAAVHNGRVEPGASLLQKPFTHRELALAVEEALDGTGE